MDIRPVLQNTHPQLSEELTLLDRALDGILFHAPDHTFSFSVALRAQEGHPVAQWLCARLNLLSPDHCANALANESLHQWTEAIAVVG